MSEAPFIITWHGGGIRPATIDDLPILRERLYASREEKVDLQRGMVWVAEHEGKLVGMLPLRLIWQAEPLMIFPEVKNKSLKRRIAIGLPRAMEAYIGDRTVNRTGIYSYFFVTKGRLWARLAKAFGCLRIYKGCMTFGRDL